MTQQTLLKQRQENEVKKVNDALVICKSCGHLVPKTNICLYCGSPILFRALGSR